jgi:hypothetical protein
MPLSDLDDAAMQEQKLGDYSVIPSEPADWKETVSLCNAHAVARLRAHIDRKRRFFLTFRFPEGGSSGVYD